jgi:hypothetical protein
VATNPYRPGVGTPPPYLADRDAQLKRFGRYLDQFPDRRRNLRLTGLRGVGKTVLLKEYRKEARNRRWVVIRRDVARRMTAEEDFATAFIADLKRAGSELSATTKLKNQLSKAIPTIDEVAVGLPGDVNVRVKKGSRAKGLLEDRARDGLLAVAKLAQSAGRGVLFLYDEAHNIYDRPRKDQYPLSALLGAFVEAQDDDDEEYPVMLVVSGLPPLIDNLQEARSHSERLFEAEELDDLSLHGDPSPAVLALTEAVSGTALSYEPSTADRIVRDVSGYPYFIQKYGEAIWDEADEAGKTTVDDDLYDEVQDSIRDALDLEFFLGRYQDPSAADQLTLRVAASLGGEQFDIAELNKEITSRTPNANQQSVNRLLQANLVYRVRQGVWAYTAPMFGDFVRRKFPRHSSDR